MTREEIQQRVDAAPLDYFWGACPRCGEGLHQITVARKEEYAFCATCRVCCYAGNRLTSWKDMTEEDFAANCARLWHFEIVEPVLPSPAAEVTP